MSTEIYEVLEILEDWYGLCDLICDFYSFCKKFLDLEGRLLNMGWLPHILKSIGNYFGLLEKKRISKLTLQYIITSDFHGSGI